MKNKLYMYFFLFNPIILSTSNSLIYLKYWYKYDIIILIILRKYMDIFKKYKYTGWPILT